MLIRFYADDTHRVVRLTDSLVDRLIDLRTGKFVPEDTPPEGKEYSSFVREAELPPLRRSVEIGRNLKVTSTNGPAAIGSVPTKLLMDQYFEGYCDYTGGLGIGFSAIHTYDFEFRQRLKTTRDAELKRLFVLQHLYQELDWAIRNFEKGVVEIGKELRRPMTNAERVSARATIAERLNDLSAFDPDDPLQEIANFKKRMNEAGDAPPE